jgi:dephospho-CoA kinase
MSKVGVYHGPMETNPPTVAPACRPRRIGLTGGVGAGKSEVARMLAGRGLPVIDTDRLAHELLDDAGSSAVQAIVARFGPGMVTPDGGINRGALAQVVFGDAHERRALEAILHPAIQSLVEERVAELPEKTPLVIVEVPLLVESGWHTSMDLVVVVDCAPETQVARFMARTGASQEEAWARVHSQLDRRSRLTYADLVVANSGGLDELAREVEVLYEKLRKSGEKDDG